MRCEPTLGSCRGPAGATLRHRLSLEWLLLAATSLETPGFFTHHRASHNVLWPERTGLDGESLKRRDPDAFEVLHLLAELSCLKHKFPEGRSHEASSARLRRAHAVLASPPCHHGPEKTCFVLV